MLTNFKVRSGLDLDGLILTRNGSELYADGLPISSSPNTNAIASAIAGDGIYYYRDTYHSELRANTNAIAQAITSAGYGSLYVSQGNQLVVNTNAIINTLAPTGFSSLYDAGGMLDVNTNAIVSVLGNSNNTDGIKVNSDGTGLTLDLATNMYGAANSGLELYNGKLQTKIYDASAENTLTIGTNGVLEVQRTNLQNLMLPDMAGSGLYVNETSAPYSLEVNTNVIATKSYVDSLAQGLDVKASVKVALNTNVDTSLNMQDPSDVNTPPTLDGVQLASGDRILIYGQNAAGENGIYAIRFAAGQWERYRTDDATFDVGSGPGTLTKGAFTFVEDGTNAGKGFVVSSTPYAAGQYEVVWSQFSAAGSYTAGNGIYLDGNEIRVNVNALAGSGLSVNSNRLVTDANAISIALQNYTPYMVTYMRDGSSSSTTNAVSAKRVYAEQTTDSNTFVTVATLAAPSAGTIAGTYNVDFFMKTTDGTYRKSMLSATCNDSGTLDYTEYAVIDSNPATTNPQVILEYDNGSVILKAKATLGLPGTIDFIAVVEYIHKD